MSNAPAPTVHAVALAGALLSLCTLGARAGNLDAPAAPTAAGSAMYTLESLYNRLDTGAEGSKRGATFAEPAAAPGSTMVTLDQIMAKLPALDATNGAAPGDVLSGKTFWGLTSAGWGLRTGTFSPSGCTCQSPASIYNAASGGTRWCVNGNGTVTDLLGATVDGVTKGRCLVWLQKADWGGTKPWRSNTVGVYDDAHTRAGILAAGTTGAGLSDGSVIGDWRLPTFSEIKALTTNPQQILSGSPGPFSGVQSGNYWSSSSDASYTNSALGLHLSGGTDYMGNKTIPNFVWPVRGGQ